MIRHNLVLAAASVVALLCATPNGFANILDDEWQALEQSLAGPSPPTVASDCDKYTVDSAKAECMDYVNKKPTFTFRTAGKERTGADTAAIRYCTRLGKTYQFKGPSAVDPSLMTYQCN
jgi:hypothetical protein